MASASPDVDTSSWASCARTDMKTIDREVQMKYDIAKNEDGPLKRTMKASEAKAPEQLREKAKSAATFSADTEESVAMSLTPSRYPGLDERLVNIEKHLAVRYGSCSQFLSFLPAMNGCSSLTTKIVSGPSQVLRRPLGTVGERLPAMGSSSFQPA